MLLCSSSLRHPGKVHIVFSVVRFPACAEHPERTGLCTGWLADRVSTIIEPYGTKQASRESVDYAALPKVSAHLHSSWGCDEPLNGWAKFQWGDVRNSKYNDWIVRNEGSQDVTVFTWRRACTDFIERQVSLDPPLKSDRPIINLIVWHHHSHLPNFASSPLFLTWWTKYINATFCSNK